jgi:subtilase family serine protease
MRGISAMVTRLRLTAAVFFTVLFFVAAIAQAEPHALMTRHVPDAVPSGVAPFVGLIPGAQRLSLALSLPLRNEAQLDDLLQNLYDPESPSYHDYLSVEEFAARFGPTEADYAAIVDFVERNGLTVIDKSANRMVLDVEGPAASIEEAFHITLAVFQHPTQNRTFYAPDREPSVDLDVSLLHISGLDNFSVPVAKNISLSGTVGKVTGSGPGGSLLGSDVRTAYYGAGSLNGAGQSLGLFEYTGYEMSDIYSYFNNAGESLSVPIENVSINGAMIGCPPASCNDTEQALDIEQAISMAPGLSKLIVYVGKSNVSILSRMASDNTAKQLSCSWGWTDNEGTLDPIFKEMMAQGQSLFVATGDQGSSTAANVTWPSDDPYVTAVGGTVLTTNGAGGSWESETGWSGSAGMPSKNGVPIPSYQQLSGVITSANRGSKTLRNIPDVASASVKLYICSNGNCRDQGAGTSFAAPQWAGITAMVNQHRLANGEAPIGFLNPTLYSIGTGSSFDSDFHDITSGSNGRYSAVVGYDLITGWGSPKGVNLIDALAPLPKK